MSEKENQSKYLLEYKQYLGEHAVDDEEITLSTDTMKRYRIEMRHSADVPLSKLRLIYELAYEGFGGKIANYVVDVGRYRLNINLLNLPGEITMKKSAVIGGGAYGSVLSKYVVGEEFVAKICRFSKENIHAGLMYALEEVAIAKLCAAFKIGPSMETRIPFDLIMYEDAVQFHLEKCKSVKEAVQDSGAYYVEEDLKKRLRRLHALHLVHRDIKPPNILWSPSLGEFVFCDFGISCYIKEEICILSETAKCGTKAYMCAQMSSLGDDEEGKVDLYYNDVYALEKSIEEIVKLQKQFQYRSQSRLVQVASSKLTNHSQSGGFIQTRVCSKGLFDQPAETYVFLVPDAYEFYRLVFAAISLDEHDFHFRQNLPKLTPEQCVFIHDILANSLNKAKMEKAIEQLRTLQSLEGSPWGDWLKEFERNLTINFDNHMPRFNKLPTVTKEWITNLRRLLGKNEELNQIELELEPVNNLADNRKMYEKILYQIRVKIFEKLQTWIDEIIKFSSTWRAKKKIGEDQLRNVFGYLLRDLSHRSKEVLLKDLMSFACNPMQPASKAFLDLLAAIIKKKESTFSLFCYVQAQDSLERCIAMLSLHYSLTVEKPNNYILRICDILLERLSMLPIETYCIEIVNIKRIQLLMKQSRMELDHVVVRQHFKQCQQLIMNCHFHQDAFAVIRVLEDRLQSFQYFELPLVDERLAHVELEQYRQFYSEVVALDTNIFAENTYVSEAVRPPEDRFGNKLVTEMNNLFQRNQQLCQKGFYRSASEMQKQKEVIQTQYFHGSTLGQRDIQPMIFEALLLQRMGRPREADELLQRVSVKVQNSTELLYHRQYYRVRVEVDVALGRYLTAFNNCKRAIQINDRFGGSNYQKDTAYLLRRLFADICGGLGQYEESIQMLLKLRNTLLQAEQPDYRKLTLNDSTTAEHMRAINRQQECADMCKNVFKLELQGLIHPFGSVHAHGIMVRIYGKQKKRAEQLLQSWKVLKKTLNLGNETECIAYTCIMKQYRQFVGDEVLSLISFARKFTEPPRQVFRGIIAEEIFLNPVPTGQLPLDMSTNDFIRFAQTRLRRIPVDKHTACYFFKRHIAVEVMPSKFGDWPEFKLLYVRTLLEAELHRFVVGKTKELLQSLPQTIELMKKCEVADTDKEDKRLLLQYVESILENIGSQHEKIRSQCPNSIDNRFIERKTKGRTTE